MQFYVLDLEIGSSHDTTFNELEPRHIGESHERPKCPICGRFVGSLRWMPPYRAEVVAHRRELGDVAFSSMDLLVSEKFRLAWTQAQLRGINEFLPLERMRARPARLNKKTVTYYYVEVRRFESVVDLDRSRVIYAKPYTCPMCKDGVGTESVRGFKIDETSWSGEDLFIAWGMSACIIVTDRVRQLRDKYGLTNITLLPTEEYFWDPYHLWSVSDYSRDVEPEPDDDTDEHAGVTN